MNNVDRQVLDLYEYIIKHGEIRSDRTGTGTLSIFDYTMKFDMSEGFPLLTTKRVPFRLVAEELLWFLKGDTDLKTLIDKNVNIWTPDGYRWYKQLGGQHTEEEFIENVKLYGFDLGNIYGHQWTNWNHEGYNQVKEVIKEIKKNPTSRRLYVTAWHPTEFKQAVLPCCHNAFQLYVHNNGKLDLKFFMRSNDSFLGLAFNIASYGLLLHLIALECGLEVGELIYNGGDVHLYLNHIEQAKEQILNEPRELPKLVIKNKKDNLEDYELSDFEIVEYNPHKAIKAPVSVGLKEETK
ncbi:thymidylate synthase [Bacillus phage Riley]|uniref:thymidylate synthase n=3 Tax=Bequatrovirus TaxID=1917990 RepID=A0A7U3TT07_9CAUD|nr:thymidylate synthase [Bacillus phage Riley]YP_009289926.1 thymidylate synthase [Bacillus phage Phrodo]AMW61533.1 thymidylate synthase [Bacillus phage Juglone]QDH49736.1 thymidylate synthase [Bacillus phage Beyonphe]QPY77282.1 thymidylate synthase [Bacillus phage Anthos]UGO48859.1 thymidylate synthase [Bacillus phage vB_BanH_JarJar]UGO50350.1 thymidylate synthase [Bacillus phage vB_BanH_RonSwanson]ULF48667.1 thymidylate synthase [Bacillus phage BillyBob]